MPRPSQTSPAEFIAAALSFIDEHGTDEFSLRSLGRHMSLSHATIYRHFASKEDLINALIDDQLGRAMDGIDLGVPPRERLKDVAIRMRDHFDQHPNLLKPWINGSGQGPNGFQLSVITVTGLTDLGISSGRVWHWLRVLEDFVVGSMGYDYAAAPHHLELRLARLKVLQDAGYLLGEVNTREVARQNRQAFEEALDVLLEAAALEGKSGSGG